MTQHVATTNDLKNGLVLNIDGQLWSVVEFQHVKPGKGGAFVRTKLKNVLSGKVVDRTFNAGTRVKTATVDKRDMQYLYKDGADFVFMDTSSYEQLPVGEPTVGDAAHFLLENQNAVVAIHEGTLRCTSSCRPRWCSRSPTPSPACRATGRPAAQAGDPGDRYDDPGPVVPRAGTKVKVDTRAGAYLGRVN